VYFKLEGVCGSHGPPHVVFVSRSLQIRKIEKGEHKMKKEGK